MAGVTIIGSTALVAALVAASVYKEQMRDLADEQWRESKKA